MKVKYEDCLKQKVIVITTDTLVVGVVDIAKNDHQVRFAGFRGVEHNRDLKFQNNKDGFKTILARSREICKTDNFAKVVAGMEPIGHYWNAFANWINKQEGMKIVIVNPYATR